MAFKQIAADALRLPADERAELAQELQDSLSGFAGEELEQAWTAEARRRLAQLKGGEIEGVPTGAAHAAALARLRSCR